MHPVEFVNLSPEDAYAKIRSGEIGYVLDTRELHEWIADRIDGSELVPVPSGESVVAERVRQLGLPKEAAILVHCRSGARSMRVMPQIAAYGFHTIYHLPSGILGWKAAGLPTVSGERKTG